MFRIEFREDREDIIVYISNLISFLGRRRNKRYLKSLHWSAIFGSVVEAGSSVKKGEKYGETKRERAVR